MTISRTPAQKPLSRAAWLFVAALTVVWVGWIAFLAFALVHFIVKYW